MRASPPVFARARFTASSTLEFPNGIIAKIKCRQAFPSVKPNSSNPCADCTMLRGWQNFWWRFTRFQSNYIRTPEKSGKASPGLSCYPYSPPRPIFKPSTEVLRFFLEKARGDFVESNSVRFFILCFWWSFLLDDLKGYCQLEPNVAPSTHPADNLIPDKSIIRVR